MKAVPALTILSVLLVATPAAAYDWTTGQGYQETKSTAQQIALSVIQNLFTQNQGYNQQIHAWGNVPAGPTGTNNGAYYLGILVPSYWPYEATLKAEETGLLPNTSTAGQVNPYEEWTQHTRYTVPEYAAEYVECLYEEQVISPLLNNTGTQPTLQQRIDPTTLVRVAECLRILNQALIEIESGEWKDDNGVISTDEIVKAIREGLWLLLTNWSMTYSMPPSMESSKVEIGEALLLSIINAKYLGLTRVDYDTLRYKLATLVEDVEKTSTTGDTEEVADALRFLVDVYSYQNLLKLPLDEKTLLNAIERLTQALLSGATWETVMVRSNGASETLHCLTWGETETTASALLALEDVVYNDLCLDVSVKTPNGEKTLKDLFTDTDYSLAATVVWFNSPASSTTSPVLPGVASLKPLALEAMAMEGWYDPSGFFARYQPTSPLDYYCSTLLTSGAEQLAPIYDELSVLKSEIRALQDQVQSMYTELTSLNKEADTNKSDISEIKSEINNINNELQSLSEKVNDLSQQLKNISESTGEEGNTSSEINDIEQELNKLENEVNSLSSELNDLKGKVNDLESLKSEVSGNSSEISKLSDELKQINYEINNVDDEVSKLEDEVSSNSGDIKSIKDEISSIQNELSKVENEIEKVSSDVSSVEKSLSSNDKLVEELRSELRTISDEVEKVTEELKSVEGQVNDNSGDISSLESKINDIKSEISDISSNIQRLESNVEQLSDDVSSIDEKVSDNSKELSEVMSEVKELESLKSEVQSLEGKLADLSGELKKMSQEIEELKDNVNSNSSDINKIESEISGLESEVSDLKAKLKSVYDSLSKLSSEVKANSGSVESIGSEVSEVKSELSSIESEVDEISKKVEGLEKEVSEIGGDKALYEEVSKLKAEVQELEKELQELKNGSSGGSSASGSGGEVVKSESKPSPFVPSSAGTTSTSASTPMYLAAVLAGLVMAMGGRRRP